MAEKKELNSLVNSCQEEIRQLKKQVEDLFNENRNLRKKLENCMTFEDYKYTLNKKIKLETQQKEFIKYLEDEIQKKREKATTLTSFTRNVVPLKHCLQKYKSIIGVSDENNKQ